MPLLSNGDFADGLTGWTVSSAGPTGPEYDPVNGWVVFGSGDNDVQDGDRLEQAVALVVGRTYTLTFSMSELGGAVGGFGLNVELVGPDDTQFLTFAQVANDETSTISFTFTSNFDNPTLRLRGGFGFGGAESFLVLDDFVLTCFACGTMIATPDGDVAVQDLRPGDLVETFDHGPQPLRWTGTRQIDADALRAVPAFRPVLIPAGALGLGLPARSLLVSQCHRVLVNGPGIELLTGQSTALVAARALVGLVGGVRILGPDEIGDAISYVHLLFDRHEVVLSDGAPTESFHPSLRNLTGMADQTRDEILSLFPALAHQPGAGPRTAYPVLKSYELRAALAA